MTAARAIQDEQMRIWNGPTGHGWVEAQGILDRMFAPFEALLADAVSAASARRVLDVGCGTGAVSLAIARRLGAGGRCTGVDISEPMVALARERAKREAVPADFVLADAENHPFEAAAFDMIVSRFGVMFFADPVRAFANLHRTARRGAGLNVLAWRSTAENPFMTVAERAAAPLLPEVPSRRPDGPGQFAFADEGRVRGILQASGWEAIQVRPVNVACAFPEAELTLYLSRLGPVGQVLQAADERARERVIGTVRAAFEPYVHGDEVRFSAACWSVSARKP